MVFKGPSRPRQDPSPTVCATGTVFLPLLFTDRSNLAVVYSLAERREPKNLKIYRTLSFGANRIQ